MDKCFLIKIIPVLSIALYLSGCSTAIRPINFAESTDNLNASLNTYYTQQKPLKNPLTLYDAMARAAKYNLDNWVKQAESVYYSENVSLDHLQMLPSFEGSVAFDGRNNDFGVFGENTTVPSISQSRNRGLWDLQASWNLLDLGVGYINTKQAADRYFIALEQRRNTMQLILRDVRYAYWRAYIFQKYDSEINQLIRDVEDGVQKSQKIQQQKVQSPLVSLDYQERLIEDIRDINELQTQLAPAKYELAGLMNYQDAARIQLAMFAEKLPNTLPSNFPKSITVLERTALMLRPEIRETVYNRRISLNEVHKARLAMLPAPILQSGYNYDTNAFLLNNEWYNYGAELTWNLIKIFSGPHEISVAKAQLRTDNIKQLSQAIAIITEVDLAYVNYHEAEKEFDLEYNLKTNQYRIYQQMQKLFEAKQASQLELLQAKSSYLLGEMRYAVSYANLQNAAGMLMQSVGYDPLPTLNLSLPLSTIKKKIKGSFEHVPSFKTIENLAANNLPETAMLLRNKQDKLNIKELSNETSGKIVQHSKKRKLKTMVHDNIKPKNKPILVKKPAPPLNSEARKIIHPESIN